MNGKINETTAILKASAELLSAVREASKRSPGRVETLAYHAAVALYDNVLAMQVQTLEDEGLLPEDAHKWLPIIRKKEECGE